MGRVRSPTDTTACLRGAAVGAASGAIALLAHALGGATGVPAGSSLTLLFGVCAVIGVATATFPRGHTPAPTMLVLAVGQGVGHLAMSLCHGPHPWTTAMAVAHLVAIPVGAVLIRAAETGMRRAVTGVRRVLRVLAGAALLGPRVRRPVREDDRATRSRLLVRPDLDPRGPPAAARPALSPVPV